MRLVRSQFVRIGIALCCAVAATVAFARPMAQSSALALYFIDVEGGQATLVVAPDGESLLVDTGYGANGRDSSRIMDAMRDAGVTRIDHLVITHFHVDHIGGAVDLASRVRIGAIYDHGEIGVPDDDDMRDTFERYRVMRARVPHSEPRVGTRLRLGDGTLTWISSDTRTLPDPLHSGSGANPSCSLDMPEAEDPFENPRSTGFLLEFGRFRFLDVGDLTGEPLAALVCPVNLIGPVDLYLLPHHGEEDGTFPATLDGFRPRAIVINNGSRKGARQDTLDLLHTRAVQTDVWQLHRAVAPDVKNFPDPMIANLDTSTSHWIRAVASRDGSFTVTNGRTRETRRHLAERQATRH
ncbi:MAG: MBL fold metallo-hydrolase [Vicinamibacterales bacterium]